VWYILAEHRWCIFGEHAWYIFGEHPWRILGEHQWYIYVRLLTPCSGAWGIISGVVEPV